MKRYLLPFLLALTVVSNVRGEDLTTLDGKVYKSIKVSSETPDAIKLMHDGGISVVKKKDVPPAFLKQHDLAAAPVSAADKEDAKEEALLAAFAKRWPTFETKDGGHYKASEIRDMDALGLKLMTDGGPVRIKFADLPSEMRAALGYDAERARSFEAERANARQATAAENQIKANAASVVDLQSGNYRVFLAENYRDGWECLAVRLKNQDREVITSRKGSSLSGGTVTYEKKKFGRIGSKIESVTPAMIQERTVVQETVEVGPTRKAVVFGLKDYNHLPSDQQGRRLWSGNLYYGGVITNGKNELAMLFTERTKALASMVSILSKKDVASNGGGGEEKRESGRGTGFAISDNGFIGTAAHVVLNADEITISVNGKEVPAKLVASDKEHDVAIIAVENVPTKPLVLHSTKTVQLGADVFTIGFPLTSRIGATPKFTKGSVSANDANDVLQISVPVQHGNSGGPLCNSDGNVVGVIRALLKALPGEDAPQNVNWATKSDYLISLAGTVPGLTIAQPGPLTGELTPEQRTVEAIYLITAIRH